MKIKGLFCAVAVAGIVGGCMTMTPSSGPRTLTTKVCPPAACDATITVDSGGNISIYPDVLQMAPGDRDPVITWILDAPNTYEFRSGSITPHTGAPTDDKKTTSQSAWNDQIRQQVNTAKRVILINKNDSKVTLYYDVKVYKKGTATSVGIDPAMVNDP